MTDEMNEKRVVFMCSGQGSQKPGMGSDLLDIPEINDTFALAAEVFGRDIASLCRASTDEEAMALSDTRNAQAAIATLSIGIGRALMARGVTPDAILGFSLGQMSALALSGMLNDRDAFALIDARSRIMGDIADANPGCMSALLKGSADEVEAVCARCAEGDVLVPANYNSPAQTVIAGTPAAVERAEAAWKDMGRPASRLATSGAFHSPVMEEACAPFAAYLETMEFAEPSIPVICNTDARPLDAQSAKRRLVDHLTHPVRFEQSVAYLCGEGADGADDDPAFVEVGFGGVLSNLVKRCNKEAERACVQDKASFEAAVSAYARA